MSATSSGSLLAGGYRRGHAAGGGELDVNLDLPGGALLEPVLDAGGDRVGELLQLLLAEQALLTQVLA
jgi:hypothetical protein